MCLIARSITWIGLGWKIINAEKLNFVLVTPRPRPWDLFTMTIMPSKSSKAVNGSQGPSPKTWRSSNLDRRKTSKTLALGSIWRPIQGLGRSCFWMISGAEKRVFQSSLACCWQEVCPIAMTWSFQRRSGLQVVGKKLKTGYAFRI